MNILKLRPQKKYNIRTRRDYLYASLHPSRRCLCFYQVNRIVKNTNGTCVNSLRLDCIKVINHFKNRSVSSYDYTVSSLLIHYKLGRSMVNETKFFIGLYMCPFYFGHFISTAFVWLQIGLYHSVDAITNPKYKLLHFLTTIFFTKRRRH